MTRTSVRIVRSTLQCDIEIDDLKLMFDALNDVAYNLGDCKNHTFSSIFPIYEWDGDDGYNNIGKWIEAAAKKAGR